MLKTEESKQVFTNQEMAKIKDKFMYVDEDQDGKARLYYY